ncbi:MAG: universal stress protein [Chitinophagaceae bacterium]|nr:universal stress protein [Chitinophagaceae bacterium]
MKRLIAPVDFSDLSVNAARYAAHLAAWLNIDLELLHIVQLPVVYGEVPMPIGEYDSIQAEATSQLNQLATELDNLLQGQLIVHQQVKVGSPVYELMQLSKRPDVYAMVMATHGAGSVERFFIGSTTQSLVEEADCPVIVVPAGYAFKKPQRLALASDLKQVTHRTPEAGIRQLVADFGAQLDILHADPDFGEFEPAAMQEEVMLETMFSDLHPKFRFLHSGEPAASLARYAEENGYDMLITLPHQRSLLESLFSQKHTGKIIRQAHLPVCVIRCRQ